MKNHSSHHRLSYCSSPAASGVQSQNWCRACKGESTSTSILQSPHHIAWRYHGNVHGETTGDMEHIGADCKRHDGLPTAESSRTSTVSCPGAVGFVCCQSGLRTPITHPCPASAVLCPQGEMWHLRISLTASYHTAHTAPMSGWIWFKCWGTLLITKGLALALISCASGFGRYSAQR